MALPLVSRTPSPPATFSFCSSGASRACDFLSEQNRRRKSASGGGVRGSPRRPVRAAEKRSGERNDGKREGDNRRGGGGYLGSAIEVTTFDQSFGEAEFPVLEKIGAVVRMSYGIGIYGAMALVGRFICSVTGIDWMGGFEPSFDVVLNGLGYATPPIMALLFILDDEVVKLSPHARAIRDVEDEELRSFFYGMSPWQFLLIVTASSVGEELFYRAAVQASDIIGEGGLNDLFCNGALSDIFLRGTNLVTNARGMVSLTGVLPPFVPFAQAFAAVITATLTGSLYFVAASPTDPTYIIAPVLQSRSGQGDLKKLFAAWYERRQMKKIYSPLLEGLLALYLGFEWIQTDNILAPIITHGVYSMVILGNRLWKIQNYQERLRRRIQKLKSERKAST